MNGTLPLVNFEQAKRLKELDFDWTTLEMYFYDLDNPTEQSNPVNWVEDIGHALMNWNSYITNGEIYMSRPSISVAIRWFREVKKIYINVIPVDSWECWTYRILCEDIMSPFFVPFKIDEEFKTYDLAESAALTKAFTI